MNLYKLNVLLITIALSAGACNKFLDRPPAGQMNDKQVFGVDSNIQALANGLYTYLGDAQFTGGRLQAISDMLADQLDGSKLTGDFSEIYKRQNSIFGGTRDDMYKDGYKAVLTANKLLEQIDKASPGIQPYTAGLAGFVRGMVHFEFVRIFA